MSVNNTSCAYCGVGCGVSISQSHDADRPVLVGDSAHPANWGRLCAKGERLLESLTLPNHLYYPRQVKEGRNLPWSEAIATIAQRFTASIAEHGPDSVALYLSGQLLTEDYYVANKFAKGFLGTANVDTNSRLCMSSAVSAHIRAFGEDVVPGCYADLELADVVVLIGANTAWTHPVLFQRILAARETRGTRLVVVDPVSTASAQQADLHLAITPGSDIYLFNGLLCHLAKTRSLDADYIAAHTQGFEAALARAQQLAPSVAETAKRCGLTVAQVKAFFALYHPSCKTVSASCQGVNQSVRGTDCTNAIINTHLALGHIGQVGCGFFSLTGQPNAMGGREVGGMATQLACHLGFSAPEVQLVSEFWQATTMATTPGFTAVELFDAMASGQIKAVWILGTNPMVSMPDTGRIAHALATCPFVVVSDISGATDTAQMADIVLPAKGWGEKSGTVTNSERTLTRQRAFMVPKGEAKSDWWALAQVAKTMGFAGFEYNASVDIFREFVALSTRVNTVFPHKVFSLSGLSELTDEAYDNLVPTQWPVRHASDIGQQGKRLFADGRFATPSGRAHFIPSALSTPDTLSEHALWLNTGRSRDQWHTMSRTGHVASLRGTEIEPSVALHPLTAARLNIREQQFVSISAKRPVDTLPVPEILAVPTISALTPASDLTVATEFVMTTGSMLARAKLDETLPRHMLQLSMHWSKQFSLAGGSNQVLDSRRDPHSQQPGFKCQPVYLQAVDIPWQGIEWGRHPPQGDGICWQVQQSLTQGQCYHLGFTSETMACDWPEYQCRLHWVHGAVQLLCGLENGRLMALRMVSSTPVSIHLEATANLMGQRFSPDLVGKLHSLLQAGTSPILCVCTGVTHRDVVEHLTALSLGAESSLSTEKVIDAVQTSLECGRRCGSCQAEVKTVIGQAWSSLKPVSPYCHLAEEFA